MMNVFINFAVTTMKVPHYFKGMDSSANLNRLIFGKDSTHKPRRLSLTFSHL